MSGRDWIALIAVLFIALVGVHQYDGAAAKNAASAAATVVYTSAVKSCHDANPTRKAQHTYFVTIARGRATSAKHADAGRPTQRAVDIKIAQVAYKTAKTYTNRPGANGDGTLNCLKTVTHP